MLPRPTGTRAAFMAGFLPEPSQRLRNLSCGASFSDVPDRSGAMPGDRPNVREGEGRTGDATGVQDKEDEVQCPWTLVPMLWPEPLHMKKITMQSF